MQTSKPFTFGFDGDDIDCNEIEGLPQVVDQSPTQRGVQGVVPPQLHSLYDLVWCYSTHGFLPRSFAPFLAVVSLGLNSFSPSQSYRYPYFASVDFPISSVISHTRVAS